MKKELLFSISVVVCCLLAVTGYCLEDWQNMGLYGGSIEEIAIDGYDADSANHYAFARVETPAGIYKAPKGSSGWTMLASFPNSSGALAIGVSEFSDIVYLYATTTTGMFYSTDGGVSWTEISDIVNGQPIFVGSDNAVYIGVNDFAAGGLNILKSTDGTTFTALFSTPISSTGNFSDITVSSDTNTIWATIQSSGTVYKWVYAGGTWTQSSYDLSTLVSGFSGFTADSVTIDPNNINTVYATGQISNNGKLAKTADGGVSWSDTTFSECGVGKVYFNSDSTIMYKSGSRSTDGGTSWSMLPNMANGNAINNVVCIQPGNTNVIYATTDQGIACSTNGGTTITAIDDGLEAVQIRGGIQHPTDSNILCISSKSGIGQTTNGGTTWNFVQYGAPKWGMAVNSDASFMYCGNTSGGVHISSDGGTTWDNSIDNGLETLTQAELGTTHCTTHKFFADPNSTNIVYTAVSTYDYTNGGIYKGVYSGGAWTWSRITSAVTPIPATAVYGYASGANTVLFAGFGDKDDSTPGISAGLQISTDSGSTWSEVTDLSGYIVNCITSDPSDSNIMYVGTGHAASSMAGDSSGKVFKSSDGGTSWTDASPNDSNEGAFRCIIVDPADPATIYASCSYKIYSSTNYGASGSWYEYYVADSGQTFESLFMFEGITTAASPPAERAGIIPQATTYNLVLGSEAGLYLWGTSAEWYFAEGCTSSDFDTWLLIANPQAQSATVTVTYFKPDSSTQTTYTVDPSSRYSIHVDSIDGLDSTDVSMQITSDQSIVCERAMYWKDMTKGHDTIGVTAPATTWYFGEGCTNGFDTWILLMNPSSTNQANVVLTFMKPDGTSVVQNETVAASRRHSVNVGTISGMEDVDLSTLVESDIPIVSERAMYWNSMNGGHCSIGTNSPSNTWYLAEGYTGGTYDTWVLIQNPGASSATCTVTYYINNGTPQSEEITVGPNSRYSIHVDNTLSDHEVSTYINAGISQVIAERAMYWGEGDNADGHCSMGSKSLSPTWYLAEGCTAGDFDEYILLMNPGNSEATVNVTYLKTDGSTVSGTYTVNGQSRYTINPDGISGLESASFSARISSNIPIAVERAMYIGTTGGHCSRGMRQ